MGQVSLPDAQRDPAGLRERAVAGEAVAMSRDGERALRAPIDAAALALRLRVVPAQQLDATALIRQLRDEERM